MSDVCNSCLTRAMMDLHCLRCHARPDSQSGDGAALGNQVGGRQSNPSPQYSPINTTNSMSVKSNLQDKESTTVGAVSIVGAVASQIVPMINPAWAGIADAISAVFASLSGLYLAFRAKRGR